MSGEGNLSEDAAVSDQKNPWGVSFATMFDMAGDSHLFATSADLKARGGKLGRDGFFYVPVDPRELEIEIKPGKVVKAVDLIRVPGVFSLIGGDLDERGSMPVAALDVAGQPITEPLLIKKIETRLRAVQFAVVAEIRALARLAAVEELRSQNELATQVSLFGDPV